MGVNLPLIDSVRLDWGALGFMVCVSTLTGALFGPAPALEGARADLNSTIKEGGRTRATSHARGRLWSSGNSAEMIRGSFPPSWDVRVWEIRWRPVGVT